jgi:hypothetical protein
MEKEKNWEARFQQSGTFSSSIGQICTKEAAVIAGAYWALVLVVFLLLQSSGADMVGDGALPIAALTVPWSLLAIAVGSVAPQAQLHPLISPLGSFFIFPVLSGGLNAVLIAIIWSAIQRGRHRSRDL